MKRFYNKLTPFAVAIWFSVTAHIVLLAVKFEPELKQIMNRLPPLEVVLVNAKTEKAPDHAEHIAQANLDRGGNTDENRQAKSMLPMLPNKQADAKLQAKKASRTAAKSVQVKAEAEQAEQRVAALENQAKTLLTQLNAERPVDYQATLTAKTRKIESQQSTENVLEKPFNREALLAASLEIDRLEAQIAKQQEQYQKRPKRRFLGARTKAVDDALYLEAWRQKVERIGNMNYPAAASNQKIYGRLQLTVSIRAEGTVEDITIDRSSGSKVLDDAAINIVKLAAPYAKFSEEMRKTTDILGITRTWTFTNEGAIYTK